MRELIEVLAANDTVYLAPSDNAQGCVRPFRFPFEKDGGPLFRTSRYTFHSVWSRQIMTEPVPDFSMLTTGHEEPGKTAFPVPNRSAADLPAVGLRIQHSNSRTSKLADIESLSCSAYFTYLNALEIPKNAHIAFHS